MKKNLKTGLDMYEGTFFQYVFKENQNSTRRVILGLIICIIAATIHSYYTDFSNFYIPIIVGALLLAYAFYWAYSLWREQTKGETS